MRVTKKDCKTMHELSDIMRMGKMSGAVFHDYLKFKEMRGELAHTKKVLDLMGGIIMMSTLNIDPVKLNEVEMHLTDEVMKKLDQSLEKIMEIKIDIPEPGFITKEA